uniref:Spindle pole body protein ppc89 n=1 Tax=Panagrellus redivivus TaxID=6233 RepID=A0A7E4ZZW1_PANRE
MSVDPQNTPRTKRPFLRKGEGHRKYGFLGAPLSARSASAANSARSTMEQEDRQRPASTSSLPFGHSHRRPTTATTQDSGIPEDQAHSNESLGQQVFVDDVIDDVSEYSQHSDNIGVPERPKEKSAGFEPHHASTPIAAEIDACQERLERVAPNSVRNAIQIMEEVPTASSSLTSLNHIATPPIPNGSNHQNASDAQSNFSEEVVHRHPEAYQNLKTRTSISSLNSTSTATPQAANHSESSLVIPRASDFKVHAPSYTPGIGRTRRRNMFESISETPESISERTATPVCNLNNLAREHGIEPDLIDNTPLPKPAKHVPKQMPIQSQRPDVSLFTTPIFSKKSPSVGGEKLELMAEQLRYQMMSIDIAKDELAQRYEKRDAVREAQFHKLVDKCNALQRRLDDANSNAVQSNDGTKAELRLARDREKAAKKEIAELKKELEAKDRENQHLKTQNVSKASTVSALRLAADKQKQVVAELTKERDSLKDKLARSESLYHKLENDLRYERKLNDLNKKQAAAVRPEPPKQAPAPAPRRTNSFNGRPPFRPVNANHGRLGSNSSTGSSTTTTSVPFGTLPIPTPFQIPDNFPPRRQRPVVVAVQRGSKSVQWSSPVAESIPFNSENGYEPYLLQFLPDNVILDEEVLDGPYQKQIYSSDITQFIWRRRVSCGCETMLNALKDYYFYCSSGTPVQLIHTAKDGVIEITLSDIRIRALPSTELEIRHGDGGDKTVITAANKRYEYFYSAESIYPTTEIYEGTIGLRREEGALAQPEEQIDGTGITAQRDDGSYCTVNGNQIVIEHPLFQLARSTDQKYGGGFRLAVYGLSGDKKQFLQISVCPQDNVVFIKHVQQIGQSHDKDLCTTHNKCEHLKR